MEFIGKTVYTLTSFVLDEGVFNVAKHRVAQLNGDGANQNYELDGSFTMGRNQQNTLVLNDPLISRNHARIDVADNGVVLRDIDSGNGTFILPSCDRFRLTGPSSA